VAKQRYEAPEQQTFDFTFDSEPSGPRPPAGIPAAAADDTPPAEFSRGASFAPHGAWLGYDRRLSVEQRKQYNALALEILQKPPEDITPSDREKLRYYSGFGGTGREGERGVLYDYYTSPPVADMTWRLLNAIKPVRKKDHILEPSCGSGVFFATAPSGVGLTGVELDERTATIAAILFPFADIKNQSFEAFNASGGGESGFDYVIGNAPFGERTVATSFMDMKEEKSLDRYFVSRGIDALKSGGVMGIIVHPGVLANESNDA
jgi:hypothetical protein